MDETFVQEAQGRRRRETGDEQGTISPQEGAWGEPASSADAVLAGGRMDSPFDFVR